MNNVMRHVYHPIDDEDKANIAAIKDSGLAFHELVTKLGGYGGSRELSLAKTSIEEAVMWATKHCTRWLPLPSVEIPKDIPILSEPPHDLTLGTLREETHLFLKEPGTLHPYTVIHMHTDMEPDARDLPGFTPSEKYRQGDALYKLEIGRLERFIVVVNPDIARFDVAGVIVYPVIHHRGDAQRVTYHTIRELPD